MPIDVLQNPATNPSITSGGGAPGVAPEKGWLSSIGDFLMDLPGDAAALGSKAIKGGGQYIWDTLTADRNSVPFSVRAAVAGAKTGEDKLNTLRQYYPDAMPTPDNDFTFIDPQTKKRVTLNDPGLSLGDIVGSLPELGEVAGSTLGGIGGVLAGAGSGPGAIATGALGAGAGGVGGDYIGRGIAKGIGYLGSGYENLPIDTQPMDQHLKDMAVTGGINALGGAIGPAYMAGKNALLSKLLTKDSAEKAAELASKGYKPTIGQIGSEAGRELDDNLVKSGLANDQQYNQQLLNQNVDTFLDPDLAKADQNSLANSLRDFQKESFKGKKDASSELYSKIQYGDDLVDAENTKKVVDSIYDKAGYHKTPDGKYIARRQGDINPDYVLDSSMQRKMNRVAQNNASEKEIDSFRSDVTTQLRKGVDKKDTKDALGELQESLTKDLVQGSPEITAADRAARQSYYELKKSQEDVKNILGRTEGVTDKTPTGVSKTEGEILQNAKKVFSSSPHGSDDEAAKLAQVLGRDEKDTILAGILNEDRNALDQAASKYNLGRIGEQLVDPAKRQAFDELMSVAPQIRGIPEDYVQRSWYSPKGFFSADQNPMTKLANQLQAKWGVKEALKGATPESLASATPSFGSTGAIMGGTQAALGNIGDASESNMRIPQKVVDEAVPENMRSAANQTKGPLDFDSLIAPKTSSSIDFDSLIGEKPSTLNQPPAATQNAGTTQEALKMSLQDAEAYIDQNYRQQAEGNVPKVTLSDAEKYISENYRSSKQRQDGYGFENKSAQKLLEELKNGAPEGTPYYQTNRFLESVKQPLARMESGSQGYGAQAHNSSAAGKYQFLDATRNSIMPGVSREEFLNNPDIQEEAMDKLIGSNIKTFQNMGVDVNKVSPDDLAGMIWAAHLRGARAGVDAYNDPSYQGVPDPNGTLPRSYFNKGKNYYQQASFTDNQ